MRNLIPHFIHENYKAGQLTGQFQAAAIFADVSGFTPMTEALMKHGKEGAEALSHLVINIFEPMVEAIYKRGGFIAGFAGDALTAIFPIEKPNRSQRPIRFEHEQALDAALAIQRLMQKSPLAQTELGHFPLAVKIGLSAGLVEWGIAGHEDKAYYFRGPAIDGCVQAEHHAQKGDLIVDEKIGVQNFNFAKEEDAKMNFCTPVASGFYRLTAGNDISPRNVTSKSSALPRLTKKVARLFLPDALINFDTPGEFRNVATVFISFDGLTDPKLLDDFVHILIRNEKRLSGYLKEVSFGDKGAMALCFFGAPLAFENNVDRALDFVLAVKRDLTGFQNLLGLKYRVGLTYGMVYAGFVGGPKRYEYSMLGDAVNTAARFMTTAQFGGTWVSEAVYQHARGRYDFESLGAFEFKGKSQPLPVYQLLDKKPLVAQAFSGKFVGRAAEMAAAARILEGPEAGRFGGALYVYGEAGVGKSRLISELQNQRPDVTWIHLPSDGVLRKAFNPFHAFFTAYFQQSPQQSVEANKAAFETVYARLIHLAKASGHESVKSSEKPFARLEDKSSEKPFARLDDSTTNLAKASAETVEHSANQAFARLAAAEIAEIERELIRLQTIMAAFVGLDYPDSLWHQLDAKGRYDNTLYAFKETFKALSLHNPVVLFVEDLHWIDPDSKGAFAMLCRAIANYPIAVLAASRYADDGSRPTLPIDSGKMSPALSKEQSSGEQQSKSAGEMALSIDLNTLTRDGAAEFAISILGDGSLADGLLDHLMQKTNGNPFFVEQTVHHYQETGIIQAQDGAWRLVKTAAEIPPSVNDLLIARIDRLSRDVRTLVQTAAVLGQEFETRLLSAMLRADQLDDYLQIGERAAIWSALSELRYIFSHALLQDAVYRMQMKTRLRGLHQLAAATIESLYPADPGHYSDLAFHYERAEDTDKAIEYLEKAGNHAKDNYQNQQALDFYDRLLPLIEREIALCEEIIASEKEA